MPGLPADPAEKSRIGTERENPVSAALVVQLAELAGARFEQISLEQLAWMLETQMQAIQSMPFCDPLHPVPEVCFDPRWIAEV